MSDMIRRVSFYGVALATAAFLAPSTAFAVGAGEACNGFNDSTLVVGTGPTCTGTDNYCVAGQCQRPGLMAVALTFDVVSDAPTYSDIDIRWAKPDNPAAAAAGKRYRDECYSAANCTGTSGTRQTMEVASWVTWPDSGDYYFWAVDDDARGGA